MKARSERVQGSEEISEEKVQQRTSNRSLKNRIVLRRFLKISLERISRPFFLIRDLIGGVNAVFILINLIIWKLYRIGVFSVK